MDQKTAITWFALGILTKRRYDFLLSRFGDLDRALRALDGTVLGELGCKPETIERMTNLGCRLQVAKDAFATCNSTQREWKSRESVWLPGKTLPIPRCSARSATPRCFLVTVAISPSSNVRVSVLSGRVQ